MSRQFIRFLVERKALDHPPRNLQNRVKLLLPQVVPTVEAALVRQAVDAATGPLKLHLLLMANCGFTQTDIATLEQSQVAWEAGTITHRRIKTRDSEKVPVVTYRLWPATHELLTRHRSRHAKLALVNEDGVAWVKDWGSDLIAAAYDTLQKHHPDLAALTLKYIRKCSAQILDSHKDFTHFSTLFLAHSPKTVKDKHYSARYPQDEFDAAVRCSGYSTGSCHTTTTAVCLRAGASRSFRPNRVRNLFHLNPDHLALARRLWDRFPTAACVPAYGPALVASVASSGPKARVVVWYEESVGGGHRLVILVG